MDEMVEVSRTELRGTDRPADMPPIDPPGCANAVLRSVGAMISWEGRYWHWDGVDWELAG